MVICVVELRAQRLGGPTREGSLLVTALPRVETIRFILKLRFAKGNLSSLYLRRVVWPMGYVLYGLTGTIFTFQPCPQPRSDRRSDASR